MKQEPMRMMDFLVQSHIGMERQGPGSSAMTLKALSFLDMRRISRAADMGCGTGGQTLVLARNIPGSIIGIDQIPDFIDVLNANAKKANLQGKARGIVASMENLPFEDEEFDLIWSEGAIDAIGFERGLAHWKGFLKMQGYVAVTCACWFTDEHPAEVRKFWAAAGSGLDTIKHNIAVMEKLGYAPIAVFTLPPACWTENYFEPREEAEKELLAKRPGDAALEGYIAEDDREKELYAKYGEHYGYAFYIGEKYRDI